MTAAYSYFVDEFGQQGWIPPEDRTAEQRELSERFDAATPSYAESGEPLATADLPEKALLYSLERKANSELLPRIAQVTGSCVACAGARAYAQAICGDVVHRGDNERVAVPFPFATYGVGRKIGGMRKTGSGSYGAAQAEAVNTWGMIPVDHPSVDPPSKVNGWLKWTQAIEYRWSHPNAWTVDYDDLANDAYEYRVLSVCRIRNTDECASLVAQGYGLTLASSFGASFRERGGYSIGEWRKTWRHQMSCSGYDASDSAKNAGRTSRLWAIDNQWGPNAHPKCRSLSKLGVTGSFWITDETFTKIIERGAVYGHSDTLGFPGREIDWGDMGMGR
tara:strand:+ start:2157 stop:3158 length:1002 start_codon:yes stop_codon:yes gene_type:complete